MICFMFICILYLKHCGYIYSDPNGPDALKYFKWFSYLMMIGVGASLHFFLSDEGVYSSISEIPGTLKKYLNRINDKQKIFVLVFVASLILLIGLSNESFIISFSISIGSLVGFFLFKDK